MSALGTVTVLGLGTVFSESQEEKRGCDNETAHTTSVKNEETQVGKDVVESERKHRDEEAVVSSYTRHHSESSDSWGEKQTEKLSRHEQSVRKARQILRRHMEEVGAPGMVVAVTVNGKQVWADGKYVCLVLELEQPCHGIYKEREGQSIVYLL